MIAFDLGPVSIRMPRPLAQKLVALAFGVGFGLAVISGMVLV